MVKMLILAGPQWLTPVILATQEADIRSIVVRSQTRQAVQETLSQKKSFTKKDLLVEWLKVKTLSLSSSTEKKDDNLGVGTGD
jgi:hypothetical protein